MQNPEAGNWNVEVLATSIVADNHVETTQQSLGGLPIAIEAVGVFPHMHQLGKKIKLTLEAKTALALT